MKTTRNLILTLSLLTLLLGCKKDVSQQTPTSDGSTLRGTISISGAFALYPLVNIWAEEFTKLHPDVRFNISAGGAGKGMADVLGGAVDLAMFSREITPQEKEKGVWWISVAKDAVLPTVSSDHPNLATLKKKGLSQEEFRKIFITTEITTWGAALEDASPEKIQVYTRSDAAGAAATWAQYLGAAGQEELKGIGVFGDPGLADVLRKDKSGIGFNNVIFVYDLETLKKYPGIEVIPIDLNADGVISANESFYDHLGDITAAIGSGAYPSPPARELYLISKGIPGDPSVIAFLHWIVTAGQDFIDEAGYIQLPETKIQEESQKINP